MTDPRVVQMGTGILTGRKFVIRDKTRRFQDPVPVAETVLLPSGDLPDGVKIARVADVSAPDKLERGDA